MVGSNWRQWMTRLVVPLWVVLLSISLASCGDRAAPTLKSASSARLAGKITEVAPPETIQELRQALEAYQPQVSILSPRADEILEDDRVSVQFRVQDLPLFKDENLGLGPHLHVFLDNQPYIAVYDATKPLELEDLPPGTHTIRAFASRPWHESFKNEGAYAQTTFHVFAKTPDNHPDVAQPLLTYSRPQGSYGAEPVMLDFYLTNAPLHLIAQETPDDEIADWRIRCTVNGESFVLDRWEPIYLKGLKSGKNWVQLEFLDEKGDPVVNRFNNTVRLITYKPNGKDPLSKLVRGDLAASEARSIVDPNYQPPTPAPAPAPAAPQPVPTPEPPEAASSPEPVLEPVPLPDTETPAPPESARDEAFHNPELPIAPSIAPEATEPNPLIVPSESAPPEPEITSPPEVTSPPSGSFFNRFRRRPAAPLPPLESPVETLPEVIDSPSLDSIDSELKASEPAPDDAASEPETEAPSEALPSLIESPLLEPLAPDRLDADRRDSTNPETSAPPTRPVLQ